MELMQKLKQHCMQCSNAIHLASYTLNILNVACMIDS